MDPVFYLLQLLEDEFRAYEDIRIKAVFPSTTQRSIDLEQDYDENANSVHRLSGVNVRTETRQYFFPVEWVTTKNTKEIEKQIQQIRDAL